MNEPDCIFCKIIRKEIPAVIIDETDDYIAFVDRKPNNFGHSLVVPKIHYENIYTLKGNALISFGQEIQKISKAVKGGVKADGINVHMNNDSVAGQEIFHAHVHIIPRFEGDGLKHWPPKEYEYPNQIEEIGEKIRQQLNP
jgi:histidine triad (HIT) family protein